MFTLNVNGGFEQNFKDLKGRRLSTDWIDRYIHIYTVKVERQRIRHMDAAPPTSIPPLNAFPTAHLTRCLSPSSSSSEVCWLFRQGNTRSPVFVIISGVGQSEHSSELLFRS